tara:strand:- start:115 stop:522 length:408 start_codon:yes stop_codon:yes gene_type:complete
MLNIKNIKLLTYGWLMCVAGTLFIKHLVDSGLLKISSGIRLTLTVSKLNYKKLLLPLLLIPIIYFLNIKHESDKDKNKKTIRRNSIITLSIITLFILSYYLTRWKIINGPFDYYNYFGSPGKDFSPIFKSFSRLN